MIKVKTFFNGWKEVTREQARKWVNHISSGIVTMDVQGKNNYINSRLQGVTIQELLIN